MFDRKSYKRNALKLLKGRWVVPLIMLAITKVVFFLINFEGISGYFSVFRNSGSPPFVDSKAGAFWWILAMEIFVSGTLLMANVFVYVRLHNFSGRVLFSDFLKGLEMFMRGIGGILWFALWTILWTYLFVIPGIVKAFSYSQMFFVMAENPRISPAKAMRISRELTKGHKADLLVMVASFIGWEILSVASFTLLSFWLRPYQMMSFTSAYYGLKEMAFKSGSLTPADFE